MTHLATSALFAYATIGACVWWRVVAALVLDAGWRVPAERRLMIRVSVLVALGGLVWPLSLAIVLWAIKKEQDGERS